MDKKYAFIFAITITLLIALNYNLFSTQLSPPREKVTISRIIDGDTLQLEDKRTIRLVNINAPEKSQPNSKLATDYLKNYENELVEIDIIGTDKYNRVLARIYTPEYLNLELVEKGLTSKFLVQQEELKLFAEAEKYAIESSKGIWRKSQYYNCFESSINQKDEIATIANNCNNINIGSWILKDESRKLYRFNSLEIGKLALHTKQGEDNETDLFWNSKTDIWNNDRDTLYLFDENLQITHYNYYGY